MYPRFSPNYHLQDLLQFFAPVDQDAISRLEWEFVSRTGHQDAVALRYGRSGLYLLLKALEAEGKNVVLPSANCVVVAHAIVKAGAKPRFVDNPADRLQPTTQALLDAVDSETAMVIPTHLYGMIEDTRELSEALKAKHPEVFLLQDCAHSFFGKDSEGNPVTAYGDGAMFGMNISKLVNSVKGGMLTLRDKQLASKVRWEHQKSVTRHPLRSLRARLYGICSGLAFSPRLYSIVDWLIQNTPVLSSETDYYSPGDIDLPKDFLGELSPIEAKAGSLSLGRFDSRVLRRGEIAKTYCEELGEIDKDGFLCPDFKKGFTWSHFPLLVPESKRTFIRTKLKEKFNAEIGVILDYSIADLPSYLQLGHPSCPNALSQTKRMLNLPLTLCEGIGNTNESWQSQAREIAQTVKTII